MSQLAKKFGKQVNHFRRFNGWSYRDLAAKCKMPHTTIFQIEKGELDPKLSAITAISKAFNFPASGFLAMLEPERAKE